MVIKELFMAVMSIFQVLREKTNPVFLAREHARELVRKHTPLIPVTRRLQYTRQGYGGWPVCLYTRQGYEPVQWIWHRKRTRNGPGFMTLTFWQRHFLSTVTGSRVEHKLCQMLSLTKMVTAQLTSCRI